MDVFLSDKAFIGIVLSTIEVYKDECLGALIGHHVRNRIFVEYAIPYQTATRKPTEVEPNWRRERRVHEILPQLQPFTHVGYFHSHTQRGEQEAESKLSDLDIESMIPEKAEIVVAINDSKKRLTWNPSGQDIYGTIGEYRMRLAAYYKRKKDEKIKHYPLSCPYVLGFDLSLGPQ